MAEAKYFHATLYQFAPVAFNEVIKRFNASIQDVSATLFYDKELHTFCLTCPGQIGQQANSALTEVLFQYKKDELAAAERQDRAPLIIPFSQATLKDETEDDALGNDQPAPESSVSLHITHAPSIIMHCVVVEESNTRIKLFRLNDLPDGLVARILAPNERQSNRAVAKGFTARVVRWDIRKEAYVFNGRVGRPIDDPPSPNSRLLAETVFDSVSDLRPTAEPSQQTGNAPTRMWRFKNDDSVDINRFLQGMGDIELVDPDTKPEEPEDASTFRAHSNMPSFPQGRARVPRAMESSGEENDSDSEGSSDESARPSITQNQDRRQTNANRTFGLAKLSVQKPGPNDDTSLPSPIGQYDEEKTPKRSKRLPLAFGQQPPSAVNDTRSPELRVTPESTRNRSSNEIQSVTQHTSDFPTYNVSYAAVDRYGLGGNAANQATWEHQNPVPKKSTTNRSGITRRHLDTSTNSISPVMGDHTGSVSQTCRQPQHSSATSSSSLHLEPPLFEYHNAQPKSPNNWEKNIVRPKSSKMKLVDDSSESDPGAPVPKPPGLDQFGSRQEPAPSSVVKNSHQPSRGGDEQDHFASLLSGFRNKAGRLQPPTTSTGSVSEHGRAQSLGTGSERRDSKQNDQDGNDIIDRLQKVPEDRDDKKHTMRQQAKKPPKTQATDTAMLPRPDPVPSSRRSKTNETAAVRTTVQASPTISHTQAAITDTSPAKTAGSSASNPETKATAIEQLLNKTGPATTLESAELNVSFGMILSCEVGSKEPFPKGAAARDKMEARLQANTSSEDTVLLTRLTTAASDAVFLLDLFQNTPTNAKVFYEFIVKNAEGNQHTIIIDPSKRNDIRVTGTYEPLGTMYIHYPIRVWDAKVVLQKSTLDNTMADTARDFVKSMQTIEEAPSFAAKIPTASFSVEKVYAKRAFSKMIPEAVELSVTEVQEMTLESANDDRYNVKATVLSADQMMDSQHWWWECALRSDVVDKDTAAKLQEIVDGMVSQMDGVGYGNKGPWHKVDIEPEAAAEQWFW